MLNNLKNAVLLFALISLSTSGLLQGGLEASALQPTDNETECREGQVLVFRYLSNNFVCVSPGTAERWAKLGLAEIVEETGDKSDDVKVTEDATKETTTAPEISDKTTTESKTPKATKDEAMKESKEPTKAPDAKPKEPAKAEPMEALFVQTSDSGTFKLHSDTDTFTLTLSGVPSTIFFSDGKQRIAGVTPTSDFVNSWNQAADSFSDDPPNAAIVLSSASESEDVIIGELTNPMLDSKTGTLQYDVTILNETGGAIAHYNDSADDSIPETFDSVSVFIDGLHLCLTTFGYLPC